MPTMLDYERLVRQVADLNVELAALRSQRPERKRSPIMRIILKSRNKSK